MVSKEFIDSLPCQLPDNYREELVIPEVKEGLYYDENLGCMRIVVTGDVSHFSRLDHPIIEIFRSIEHQYRAEIGIIAGCPRFSSATNTTSCNFLPNNIKNLGKKQLDEAMNAAVERIAPSFEEVLSRYFIEENNGFADWQIYHSLLDQIVDNKDAIDTVTKEGNKTLKTFIKKSKLRLPEHKENMGPEEAARALMRAKNSLKI